MYSTTALFFCTVSMFIALFFFICNIVNIKYSFMDFVKYLILITTSTLFILLFLNPIIFIISALTVLVISLKLVLKTTFKRILLPLLISYCVYQIGVNFILLLLAHHDGTVKFNVLFYFGLIVALPIFMIMLSQYTKPKLRKYFSFDKLEIMGNKQYSLLSVFLLYILFLLDYVTYNNINPTSVLGNLNFQNISIFFNTFMFLSLIMLYIFLKYSYDIHMAAEENKSIVETTENLKELNKELRGIKHDFQNHLQVISGLIQLRKYNECFEYVMGLNNSCASKNSIKSGLISINALLNAKQLHARHKNIKMDLEIESQLDCEKFSIKDWEVTRVLGNLIDNAIFEESKVSTFDKYIKVKINEDDKYYSFTVYNKNSYIPHHIKNRIFESGISTKGSNGHGMGLYIIKNIVDKYRGKIELDSNISNGTNFSIYFPKNNQIAIN